jgi:P27 family predicted phage terminase small subunit
VARPRKPDHLKLVSGTAQPCRINANAPKPKRERPSPPAHLSDRAKSGWAEAVLIADRMGVLTEADGLAMEALAETIADIRAARASLMKPLFIEGAEGKKIKVSAAGERYYWTFGKGGPMRRARPEIADISDADRRLSAWMSKFGMTPADRSRVSGETEKEPDAFDEMFGS